MSLGNLQTRFCRCAFLLAFLLCSNTQAQLRVVTYNTATAQSGSGTQTARLPYSSTILEAIGLESVNGLARPIDVLLLQEQFNLGVTTDSFVDVLNDLYDPVNRAMYARGDVSGAASSDFNPSPGLQGSGGRPAMIYNTQTVELISEASFGSVGPNEAQARQFLRYEFRPVGYDANAVFYAYSSHYRAGDDGINATSRFNEAVVLRTNSDALGEGTHAIYAGDYNIPSSNATMYQHLLSSGNGQAFDPVSSPGTWLDNASFKHLHTQSPAATGENIPGYAGGGMDDRFDFQLVTGELLDNEGMSILPNSYHVFGNNGTHTLNGSITTGTGASVAVLDALINNSDHLPVVADYQLPAKMLATLAAIPTNVAQGATVGIDVFVENVADVLNASWADELDYTISVSGSLLGSATDTSFPLAGANTHQIFLNTGTEGFRAGVVTVSALSQGAANALYQFPVNFTVGSGNGGPVFGVVAKDTFDEDENLLSYSQTPLANTFTDPQDGFQQYQVGVSTSIPNALKDDSTNGFSIDAIGVVNTAVKTDIWFGINDLENGNNPGGTGSVVWEFDVSGAIDMQVSIDMAAMGDFEDGEDTYNWTYQIDDGPILELFTSSVDNNHPNVPYTMADGDVVNLPDPLFMTTAQDETVQLTNSFQTLTSLISGLGDVLTITLDVVNNADEPYAFDNLIIEGTTFVEFLEADFNQDGNVDGLDLAEWQGDYGLNSDSDADFDGDSDGRDFLIWQQQFGQSTLPLIAASTAVIPEPTGLLLATLCGGLALVCRLPVG
ncbi:MAG: hypothetical protein SH868_02150 [Bythopirellula sp.]|nr:hypothetical protein [Bythopirellula sp.]